MSYIYDIFGVERNCLASLPGGDPSIKIAVLDGPVNLSHPCLTGADIETIDPFEYIPIIGGSATKHGTQIMSIIFGQENTPLVGMAPACRGISIPVYKDGKEKEVKGASQMILSSAIEYAIQAGASIINISGGQKTKDSSADKILEEIISRCTQQGILIVAAAGNEGCACLRLPAAINGVLAVGAHDQAGAPLDFCNFGDEYRAYGVLAPGALIPVASDNDIAEIQSGTSYAAAIISGLAARICAALNHSGRYISPSEVGKAIFETADDCDATDKGCSPWPGRRLNIKRLLQFLEIDISFNNSHTASKTKEIKMGDEWTVNPAAQSVEAPEEILLGTKAGDHDKFTTHNTNQIVPACNSGCSCGNTKSSPVQLVYALGQLDIDFGTEARRDSFMQHLNVWRGKNTTTGEISEREIIKRFLDEKPEFDDGIMWVLKLDTTTIYALRPAGPYAPQISKRLREAYVSFAWDTETRVDLISIPGVARGSATLLNGQIVPILYPDLRGIYDWTVEHLVSACLSGERAKENDSARESLIDFLNRVYFELRNLGQSGIDRALNYSATQAWQVAKVFERAVTEGLVLRETPIVVKSPICRPESDCYDVVLTFFDPNNRLTKASRAFRFTVDVSDIIPVMVGPVRSWYVSSTGIA